MSLRLGGMDIMSLIPYIVLIVCHSAPRRITQYTDDLVNQSITARYAIYIDRINIIASAASAAARLDLCAAVSCTAFINKFDTVMLITERTCGIKSLPDQLLYIRGRRFAEIQRCRRILICTMLVFYFCRIQLSVHARDLNCFYSSVRYV